MSRELVTGPARLAATGRRALWHDAEVIASLRAARCAWVQIAVAAVIAAIALAGCGKGASSGSSGSAAPSGSRAPASGSSGQPAAQLAPARATSPLPAVDVADLPPQAVQTLTLIREGGPFPYSKDGATFGNREGLLPRKPSGFYREYTVKKPGEDDRGPWRIVTGRDGSRFWTADHYASFEEVVQP